MPRQVISLLFTDIVDSTALFTALGVDRADVVRSAHDRAVTRDVDAAGGTVVLVSHDEGFVTEVATTVWRLEHAKLTPDTRGLDRRRGPR